jgi:putative membrane protein
VSGARPPPPGAADRGWVPEVLGPEGPVRHDRAPLLAQASRPDASPLALGFVALLALIAGVAALQLANFVAAQFERSSLLGALTLSVLAPGAVLLLWSGWREWRGYAVLGAVEGLRADLASENDARARAAAERWLKAIQAPPGTLGVALATTDAATLRALLRAGPLRELEAQTAEAGRRAALQVLAATAVSPWPGLDGVIIVWRALRLVREVAALHGMRPGAAGTLRLLRHATLDAATVIAADVAVTALEDSLFTSPLLGGLAGQAAGAAIAARRMLRLAHAVGQGCRPL